MKNRKAQAAPKAAKPVVHDAAGGFPSRTWHYLLAAFAALLVTLEVYSSAINGPFLFDDMYLPFLVPGFGESPLRAWLAGVRPALMLTFWANYRLSGLDPYSYHVFNVFAHFLTSCLVFLIVGKFLGRNAIELRKGKILALFCGLIYLLHPLQTESVSYVASRSETLSVFLAYAAYTVFLYRREETIGILESLAVLVLFGAASLTKEHVVVLPALLLLTDFWFHPGNRLKGILGNWKLYLPIAVAAGAGLYFVRGVLRTSASAGFALKDLPWHHYLFSQCRAIWVYLRMFLLPVGQNLDHEFAVSRSPMDHGAFLGMAALAILAVLAWMGRKRFPLASFGYLAFLILLAPTSSFVPIQDLLVERRIYLPMIGLLLVLAELLSRVKLPGTQLLAAMAAVLVLLATATWNRNRIYSDPLLLWADSASKSPHKIRPRFQLAYAYYSLGRCEEAAREYSVASKIKPPDYELLVDWGLALDCAGRPREALDKLNAASLKERSAHVYSMIGMIHGKQGNREEALKALNTAISIDSRFPITYVYRGNVHMLAGEYAEAVSDFSTAVGLSPNEPAYREALAKAQAAAAKQKQVKTN